MARHYRESDLGGPSLDAVMAKIDKAFAESHLRVRDAMCTNISIESREIDASVVRITVVATLSRTSTEENLNRTVAQAVEKALRGFRL